MQLKTRVLIVAQPANRYIVAFHIAILYDILLTYQAVAVKRCRWRAHWYQVFTEVTTVMYGLQMRSLTDYPQTFQNPWTDVNNIL